MNKREKSIYYNSTKAAKLMDIDISTLLKWDREDRFKPDHRTAGGWRRYSQEQIDNYLNNGKS